MSKGDFINNDNDKHNHPTENGEEQTPQEKNYVFFFIAIGCLALGGIFLGLAFLIKGAGTYMLIASMFCELAGATFLNAQKRKYVFKWIMIVRIACYAVMAAALIIFTIGATVVNVAK